MLPIIEVAKANPAGMAAIGWKDIVQVYSPKGTYNTDMVFLNFTVETFLQTRPVTFTLYNLHTHECSAEVDVTDARVEVKVNTFPSDQSSRVTYLLQYNYNITDLADGSYSLTVRTLGGETDSSWFTIKTTGETTEIPEFPSWTPFLISGLIATFLISIIYRRNFIQDRRK
jgi:hypothetical protein